MQEFPLKIWQWYLHRIKVKELRRVKFEDQIMTFISILGRFKGRRRWDPKWVFIFYLLILIRMRQESLLHSKPVWAALVSQNSKVSCSWSCVLWESLSRPSNVFVRWIWCQVMISIGWLGFEPRIRWINHLKYCQFEIIKFLIYWKIVMKNVWHKNVKDRHIINYNWLGRDVVFLMWIR